MSDRPVLVLAPNWLGDAVLAVPAIQAIARHRPEAPIVVSVRRPLAPLYACVGAVQRSVALEGRDRRDIEALRAVGAGTALLLPNSFHSAWLAWRAGIPERWGFARDARRLLLTRPIRPPRGSVHQAEYYLELLRRLGVPARPAAEDPPRLRVGEAAGQEGRALLQARGWNGGAPLVGLAPGAAYGSAKRWPPAQVARLIDLVHTRTPATCVMFGTPSDAPTAQAVKRAVTSDRRPIDLVGDTDLGRFIAAVSGCRVFVSNDSGAMHVAAAVGVPLVAIFGPTREHETGPLALGERMAAVLTADVWCRPCMLRDCPIDHRCMVRIDPERVFRRVAAMLDPSPSGVTAAAP